MFEYLMPHLFQKTYEDSVLMQSCIAAVARQKEYGRQRGGTMGDLRMCLRSLGREQRLPLQVIRRARTGFLKRGLSKDLVISPYSTALAVEFDPKGAISNLDKICLEGGQGLWGHYEGAGLYAGTSPGREKVDCRSLLHGPSPGNESAGLGEFPRQCEYSTALP